MARHIKQEVRDFSHFFHGKRVKIGGKADVLQVRDFEDLLATLSKAEIVYICNQWFSIRYAAKFRAVRHLGQTVKETNKELRAHVLRPNLEHRQISVLHGKKNYEAIKKAVQTGDVKRIVKALRLRRV